MNHLGVSRQGSKCYTKRSCPVGTVNIFISPEKLVLSNMVTSTESAERINTPSLSSSFC